MVDALNSALDGTRPAGLPFELSGNLIYLTLHAAGRPLNFLLETGASVTALEPAIADALGIARGSRARAIGAGSGSPEVEIVQLPSLRLGGAELTRVPVALHPFEEIRERTGRNFDGLLGVNVLRRFVVDIDYPSRRLRLHDPQGFVFDPGLEVIPFRLELSLVHVPGRVIQTGCGVLDGDFVIDTGAGGDHALVLTAPFVRAHGLPGPAHRTLSVDHAGVGIGGAIRASIGRVDEFRIGSLTLKRPVTHFSDDADGFLSWPGRAGIVGNEILRRMRVVIDYPRQRIGFQKSEAWDQSFEFDMSGLQLAAEGAARNLFRVIHVLADSPAAEAGLKPGDVIAGVDGTPTRALTLNVLHEMFAQQRRRVLSIERPGGRLQVQLETRRLV